MILISSIILLVCLVNKFDCNLICYVYMEEPIGVTQMVKDRGAFEYRKFEPPIPLFSPR